MRSFQTIPCLMCVAHFLEVDRRVGVWTMLCMVYCLLMGLIHSVLPLSQPEPSESHSLWGLPAPCASGVRNRHFFPGRYRTNLSWSTKSRLSAADREQVWVLIHSFLLISLLIHLDVFFFNKLLLTLLERQLLVLWVVFHWQTHKQVLLSFFLPELKSRTKTLQHSLYFNARKVTKLYNIYSRVHTHARVWCYPVKWQILFYMLDKCWFWFEVAELFRQFYVHVENKGQGPDKA